MLNRPRGFSWFLRTKNPFTWLSHLPVWCRSNRSMRNSTRGLTWRARALIPPHREQFWRFSVACRNEPVPWNRDVRRPCVVADRDRRREPSALSRCGFVWRWARAEHGAPRTSGSRSFEARRAAPRPDPPRWYPGFRGFRRDCGSRSRVRAFPCCAASHGRILRPFSDESRRVSHRLAKLGRKCPVLAGLPRP